MIRRVERQSAGRSRAVALAAAVGGCLGLAWTEVAVLADQGVFRDSAGFPFLLLAVPGLAAVWAAFAWLLFSAARLPRPGLVSVLGAIAACVLWALMLCVAAAITNLDVGRLGFFAVCVGSAAGGHAAVAALIRPRTQTDVG